MTAFGNYSYYYDLFYKDKDYEAEVTYIDGLIQQNIKQAKSILDLGCGTGRHDFFLAEKGYMVTAIDSSKSMLDEALKRLSRLEAKDSTITKRLEFYNSDIRVAQLNKKFDVIISLFHVISYLLTNDDLQKVFQTVKEHLNPGGIFIFDFWYGPAVLTDFPVVRIKRAEDNNLRILRIAEPTMKSRDNVVDVNYHMYIEDKSTGKINVLHECHSMRYFFNPEIEYFLLQNKLDVVNSFEFFTNIDLDYSTWNGCYLARLK